jgi:hypothetical protein
MTVHHEPNGFQCLGIFLEFCIITYIMADAYGIIVLIRELEYWFFFLIIIWLRECFSAIHVPAMTMADFFHMLGLKLGQIH